MHRSLHRPARLARPALALIAAAAAQAASAQNLTAELNLSRAATQIGAPAAWALGATGRGVTVAVLDTGLNLTHPEFAGRIATGFNTTGSGTSPADGHGHGTHVAGLIAAARDGRGMVGVAYEATLLPVKVLRDDGSGSTTMMDAAMRALGTRAQIVNMSLGGSSAGSTTALRTAVGQGLLIVAAAGNRGAAHPDWPARYAREAWANNQIIAVGAVDANSVIASFSNRAGDTAPWFLVAPGVSLASTYKTGYAYMSGTSMATPVVSGAAALVKSRWPYLRADQVANVLFVTATDLGAPGIDAVYGRGLVNVAAAMQPVGNISTALWNGRSVRVLASGAVPTPAVGGLWGLAVGGQLQTIGQDELGRDFGVDLGERVARPQPLSHTQVFARLDRRLQMAEQVLADGSRWTAAYDLPAPRGPEALHAARPATPFAHDRADAERLLAFSFDAEDAQGRAWSMGLGLADRWFGLQGTGPGQALHGVPALANPYFSLVPTAAHAGAALPLLGGQLKAGVLSSALRPALLDAQGAAGSAAGAGARAAVLEYAHSVGPAALSLGWTGAAEAGSFLGSRSGGALSLGDAARTDALNLGLAWTPAPGWALGAQAGWGRTPGHEGGDSLIRSLSTQRTESWALALVQAGRWQAGDRLTVSLSQPLRTRAGTLQFDAPQGVDEQGQLQRDTRTLSLVPLGRERLLEFGYGRPQALGGAQGWLDLTLALRRNAGHLADAPLETAAMLRWQARF